jgi:hypothetical protein
MLVNCYKYIQVSNGIHMLLEHNIKHIPNFFFAELCYFKQRIMEKNIYFAFFTGDPCTRFWRKTSYNSIYFECFSWVSY